MIRIRPAVEGDRSTILAIIAPALRSGETYAVDTDLSDEAMLDYWFAPSHEVFVAETDEVVLGTAYLMANRGGNGSHVANAGFITAGAAQGRGVARAMGLHALERARERGFRAMQFNHVVSSNERAVRLWESLGFRIVGTLPGAFRHPHHGYVDAYVMWRDLTA